MVSFFKKAPFWILAGSLRLQAGAGDRLAGVEGAAIK
jgi:hypothetical protein